MITYLSLRLFVTAVVVGIFGAICAAIGEDNKSVRLDRFSTFLFWVAGILVFGALMNFIWDLA